MDVSALSVLMRKGRYADDEISYAVIADLARQRWLENGQAREEMWDYLNHFYSFGGTSRPIGVVAGKFY